MLSIEEILETLSIIEQKESTFLYKALSL